MFEHTDHNSRKMSRRAFLKGIAAGMGTAVPAFLLPGPEWRSLLLYQSAPFTSWGQTTLSFADLSSPFMEMDDWHAQYLPIVTQIK